jgi:hypothetical protein
MAEKKRKGEKESKELWALALFYNSEFFSPVPESSLRRSRPPPPLSFLLNKKEDHDWENLWDLHDSQTTNRVNLWTSREAFNSLSQDQQEIHPMSWLAVTFTTQEINSLILVSWD